jgi:hypothetical protein
MSKHRPDEKFSPLLWLIPVPFIMASFVPLTIDHPMPPKAQQVASSAERNSADSAASSPRLPHNAE